MIETVLSTNVPNNAGCSCDHTRSTDDGATAKETAIIQQCHLQLKCELLQKVSLLNDFFC